MNTFSTMILTSFALCVATTTGIDVTVKGTLCCMTKEQCENSGEPLSNNLAAASDVPSVTCEVPDSPTPTEMPTEYPTRPPPTQKPTSMLRQQQEFDDYEAWVGDCEAQDPDVWLWRMDPIFDLFPAKPEECRAACNADASCTGFRRYSNSRWCVGYDHTLEGFKSDADPIYTDPIYTTCYIKRSATPAPSAVTPAPTESPTPAPFADTPAPTATVSNRRRLQEDGTWDVTYVFSTTSMTDAEQLSSEIAEKADLFWYWWSISMGVWIQYEQNGVSVSGAEQPSEKTGESLEWVRHRNDQTCEQVYPNDPCFLTDFCYYDDTCAYGTFAIDESGALTFEGGYVCDDSFDENAGKMICGLLGEDFTSWLPMLVESDDFTLDGLACPDGATTLDDCYYNTESEDCFAHEGVRLTCGGDGYGGDESTISAGEIVLLIFLLLLGCCCTSCIIYCVCFGGLAAGILCCKKTNDNVGEEGDNHV